MSKDKLSEEDRALFREAVENVRPLRHDKIKITRQRRKPIPRQRQQDEQRIMQSLLSDPVDVADIQTGDEAIFSRSGVQASVMRKLRRGQVRIEAELDLHRMNREAARSALVQFLATCRQQQKRCVRIIHGKGLGSLNKQPVLKGLVNHWLQQRDDILAFCSARPNDGGSGALYVLLRKAGM